MKAKEKPKQEEKRESIFKTVVTAATRAIELNEGSQKLVDAKPEESALGIALKEIAEGKVSYKVKKSK